VDGSPLEWTVEGFDVAIERHPTYRFTWTAPVPTSGRLTVQDTNYLSSYGTSRIAFEHAATTSASGYDGPARLEAVPERPVWMLSDEEEGATRNLEVTYESDLPPRERLSERSEAALAESGEPPLDPADSDPEVHSPPSKASQAARSDDRPSGLLSLLLRPAGRSSVGLWFLAALLGAAHAIQPGHGKTVIVASTAGASRPALRSLTMAVVIGGLHVTVSVGLALLISAFLPERLEGWDAFLARATGVILGIVGAWRLGRHLGGHGDHDEPGTRRGPETSKDRSSLPLAVAVGLIPCWDAILLMAFAVAVGRAALGLSLVVAFSLGAASTLLALALLCGWLGTLAARFSDSRRSERVLGLVGSLVIVVAGILLTFRA